MLVEAVDSVQTSPTVVPLAKAGLLRDDVYGGCQALPFYPHETYTSDTFNGITSTTYKFAASPDAIPSVTTSAGLTTEAVPVTINGDGLSIMVKRSVSGSSATHWYCRPSGTSGAWSSTMPDKRVFGHAGVPPVRVDPRLCGSSASWLPAGQWGKVSKDTWAEGGWLNWGAIQAVVPFARPCYRACLAWLPYRIDSDALEDGHYYFWTDAADSSLHIDWSHNGTKYTHNFGYGSFYSSAVAYSQYRYLRFSALTSDATDYALDIRYAVPDSSVYDPGRWDVWEIEINSDDYPQETYVVDIST